MKSVWTQDITGAAALWLQNTLEVKDLTHVALWSKAVKPCLSLRQFACAETRPHGINQRAWASVCVRMSLCVCRFWSNICLHSQAKGAKQKLGQQSDKRQEEQKKRETQWEGTERAIDEMKEGEEKLAGDQVAAGWECVWICVSGVFTRTDKERFCVTNRAVWLTSPPLH